jgi:hypothetical protein
VRKALECARVALREGAHQGVVIRWSVSVIGGLIVGGVGLVSLVRPTSRNGVKGRAAMCRQPRFDAAGRISAVTNL